MWEVTATNGTKERRAITSRWDRANDLAKKALSMGWKVRIKTVLADIIVTNTEGDFLIVATKIKVQDAARFSIAWMKKVRPDSTGCMIWPHGRPMPDGWRFVR